MHALRTHADNNLGAVNEAKSHPDDDGPYPQPY